MPASRILLWSGLVAAAGGAVLCVLGWYGISGERFAERQLPYLASCTVPGAALIVAGAVLVVAAYSLPVRPPEQRGPGTTVGPATEGGPATAEGPGATDGPEAADGQEAAESPPPSSEGPPLRVPGGTLAHRPDCPLIAGKPEATEVGDAALAPCPVCEPWPP
ncbi:hypothetical protein PV371_28960 [Streptomyces sp. TX20-6-3]|uniref:hypothetical protein n=1 Tax=Streptomyces sp. TX20-6-3 TaxID=3028705 RepID=UPI0029B31CC1|nr:hypothetical protein [Streptomyces sp. TX20-6-3]MDX2563655.1 hypothetical protein [Streptomyces sp. TX20-6-3]